MDFKEFAEKINLDKSDKIVDCADQNLLSLDGIEEFPCITHLKCNNNMIKSLKPLSHCPKLRYVNCSYNNISSIEGINENIKTIYLNDNPISDIKILKNNTALFYIDVRNTGISYTELYTYIKDSKVFGFIDGEEYTEELIKGKMYNQKLGTIISNLDQ